MKYAILFFLLMLPVCSRAQITLEHTYQVSLNTDFDLVEVDSGVWRYAIFNRKDTLNLFYLDHSFDRTIKVPVVVGSHLLLLSQHLFDLDDEYEYLIYAANTYRIYKEDGKLLFSCDTCYIGFDSHEDDWGISLVPSAFVRTDRGTKMIVERGSNARREVYSLPGKLPGCSSTTLGIHNSSSALTSSTHPGLAYPNPSEGSVRIAYDLPPGVSSGELIMTSEDGREVKRYHITSAFNDLLIEHSGLPSGSYFYRVVTEKGESSARRIVWLK